MACIDPWLSHQRALRQSFVDGVLAVGAPYYTTAEERAASDAYFDSLSAQSMQIPFKRLHPKASAPTRVYPTDAGADLYALDDPESLDYLISLSPGERRAFRTGISLAVPAGYYARIAPRSGLAAKQGIDVLAGVVDATYRGEVKVILVNLGQESVRIEPGQRIAQVIIEKCAPAEFVEVEDLEQTSRGAGGFGSSGMV